MPAEMTTFSTRMEKPLKAEMDRVAQQLGISTSAAINVFARKFVATGGFPFSVTVDVPSRERYTEEMDRRLERMLAGAESEHDILEA